MRRLLDGVPWRAQWGRLAEIEVAHSVHAHAVEEGHHEHVDALGHLGLRVTSEATEHEVLSAREVAGLRTVPQLSLFSVRIGPAWPETNVG